ncbi:MAG TPA: hypothetical protein VG267_18065 [Terracidiphilus sp.]|jgi:hypothetical protein|nr:hypothetical protein [Terracidiphilus sp.]
MASQFTASQGNAAAHVAVGEPVTVEGCEGQYVVLGVDHARGRVELVKLKPGHIVIDIPIATVRRACAPGSYVVVRNAA